MSDFSSILKLARANNISDDIKNIIGNLIDKSRRVSEWSELPPCTPLYNLFDGIISLTSSDIRDPRLKQLFNFSEP